MRILKYCNVELHICKEQKHITCAVGPNKITTTDMDMLLDTLNIWHKLGYIELKGDLTKMTDVQSGVEMAII